MQKDFRGPNMHCSSCEKHVEKLNTTVDYFWKQCNRFFDFKNKTTYCNKVSIETTCKMKKLYELPKLVTTLLPCNNYL